MLWNRNAYIARVWRGYPNECNVRMNVKSDTSSNHALILCRNLGSRCWRQSVQTPRTQIPAQDDMWAKEMFNVSRYYRGLPHEFRNSFSPLIRHLEHQKMAHIFEGPPGEIFMPAVKSFLIKSGHLIFIRPYPIWPSSPRDLAISMGATASASPHITMMGMSDLERDFSQRGSNLALMGSGN